LCNQPGLAGVVEAAPGDGVQSRAGGDVDDARSWALVHRTGFHHACRRRHVEREQAHGRAVFMA
jgi:hypothetical protein